MFKKNIYKNIDHVTRELQFKQKQNRSKMGIL